MQKAILNIPIMFPLKRAYENWEALERVTGSQVYFGTGLFMCRTEGKRYDQWVRLSAGNLR
jgi:hypothetical protein